MAARSDYFRVDFSSISESVLFKDDMDLVARLFPLLEELRFSWTQRASSTF